MNLKELKKMIAEEYSAYTKQVKEQDLPGMDMPQVAVGADDIKVNNDDADTSKDEPPISKMEITTKLLVADGDIVVIGGIKSNSKTKTRDQVPGLGNVPVIGNLLKYKKDEDNLEELLIFIAPRIL